MLNKMQVIGRLGRDPSLKETQNGKHMATCAIATDAGWGDNKKTIWFDIIAFGKMAENFAKYTAKGSLVYIEGELETNQWETKDGEARFSVKIVANNIRFLSKKQEAADDGDDEDDVPF